MSERWLTLAGALMAFILFFALFVGDALAPEPPQSVPLSTDHGVAGYQALSRWLTESGIRVHSLRQRYDQLPALTGIRNGGNLLLTILPHRYPIRHREDKALGQWLKDGNHLLILNAQPLTESWSADLRGNSDEMIYQYAGAWEEQREVGKDKGGRIVKALLQTDVPYYTLAPRGRHPLLDGITEIKIAGNHQGRRMIATRAADQAVLGLMQFADLDGEDNDFFTLTTYGQGRVMLMMAADVFSNSQLQQADNARLITNIINQYVAADGLVIFDDMHQGLSTLYDPEAFFADPRLQRSLTFLFCFWLIYVLAYTHRFVRVRPLLRRKIFSLDYIEALSRFWARCLKQQDAATQIMKNFFNDVRRHFNLPQNGEPEWELLRQLAHIRDEDVQRLYDYYRRAGQGKRINLVRLHNLTIKIRNDLS